ncbi:MAG TPA: DUF3618 domain-containing protein [Xanthobacteraceae bacterium]
MATQAEARSLSEFEREAEHTRADLIHTVDELHHRVSAQRIKEEVKAYARESGQDFVRNLEQRARENPLQTVAVAAGLAYPAWRLLMNIPVPVLLVGAGLALAGRGGTAFGRSYATGGGTESLGNTARRTMQDASSAMSDTLTGVKERAVGAAGDAKGAATAGMNALGDRAAAAAGAVGDAVASARNVASDTLSGAQETLAGTYQSGVDAMARSGDQLTDTLRRSGATLAETIEEHPFVWGAVGLLAGAVIASALPVSEAEHQMFGDTSDQLKNRATDLANRGLQVATEAAQDVYQQAAARAKEQGIDADVVRDTIKHAGEKIGSVAERASDALGKEDSPPTAPSISNHNPKIGE